MSAWFLLGFGLYLAVEWVVASWLATFLGWGGVLLAVLVLILVGAAVMRRAGANAFRSLRPQRIGDVTVAPAPTQETVEAVSRDVSDAGSLFIAGLLIAIPGIVTSVVGLVLLIPPVRRWAASTSGRVLRRRAERAGLVMDSRITTVQGDVVRDTWPPQPQDRPVRGEIISGEIVRDDPLRDE
jgi:UPF0716 protein FxsA